MVGSEKCRFVILLLLLEFRQSIRRSTQRLIPRSREESDGVVTFPLREERRPRDELVATIKNPRPEKSWVSSFRRFRFQARKYVGGVEARFDEENSVLKSLKLDHFTCQVTRHLIQRNPVPDSFRICNYVERPSGEKRRPLPGGFIQRRQFEKPDWPI